MGAVEVSHRSEPLGVTIGVRIYGSASSGSLSDSCDVRY